MNQEDIIEIDGENVDLSNVSDDELLNIKMKLESEKSDLKELIKEYLEKYPFLKNK